jgi:hypothetical protein
MASVSHPFTAYAHRDPRADYQLVVRMQRMDPTPELQPKERRWLPVLAPRLPLPVRFGEPSERFPKHWTVMTWVPGEPLDYSLISRGDHAADALAGFLKALHVEAPAEAPASSDRSAPPSECTDGFDHFFHAVDLDGITDEVRGVWDDAVAAPEWEGPPLWVHGDLHPANVVVSDGTLSGVIDFGDMFAGDQRLLGLPTRRTACRGLARGPDRGVLPTGSEAIHGPGPLTNHSPGLRSGSRIGDRGPRHGRRPAYRTTVSENDEHGSAHAHPHIAVPCSAGCR